MNDRSKKILESANMIVRYSSEVLSQCIADIDSELKKHSLKGLISCFTSQQLYLRRELFENSTISIKAGSQYNTRLALHCAVWSCVNDAGIELESIRASCCGHVDAGRSQYDTPDTVWHHATQNWMSVVKRPLAEFKILSHNSLGQCKQVHVTCTFQCASCLRPCRCSYGVRRRKRRMFGCDAGPPHTCTMDLPLSPELPLEAIHPGPVYPPPTCPPQQYLWVMWWSHDCHQVGQRLTKLILVAMVPSLLSKVYQLVGKGLNRRIEPNANP